MLAKPKGKLSYRLYGEKEEVMILETLQISLAAARVNANMTQEDVAQILKVSKQTIVNWEKGRVIPSFATVQTLSTLYSVPIDYIFLPKKST
jgi:DNA-binding XRE family transcriptional regulator